MRLLHAYCSTTGLVSYPPPIQQMVTCHQEHKSYALNMMITLKSKKKFCPLGVSSEPQNPAALIDSFSPAPLALQPPPSDSGLQWSLVLAKRNVCELRMQLNQLRHLQVLTCVLTNYNQCNINHHDCSDNNNNNS